MDDLNAPRSSARLTTFRFILLAVVSAATFGALSLPDALRPAALPLNAGDVSPRVFQSPRDASFESAVLTGQRRQAAADSVPPVYSPPNPAISRQQMKGLRAALESFKKSNVW